MTDSERWNLPALTGADHCDLHAQCNAVARVRVVLMTGDLYFCGHHYADREQSLASIARYVQDEREPSPEIKAGTRIQTELESIGRMHMLRGINSIDPCRWCTRRLETRRAAIEEKNRKVWHNYYMCTHCDETAADFTDWQKLAPSA